MDCGLCKTPLNAEAGKASQDSPARAAPDAIRPLGVPQRVRSRDLPRGALVVTGPGGPGLRPSAPENGLLRECGSGELDRRTAKPPALKHRSWDADRCSTPSAKSRPAPAAGSQPARPHRGALGRGGGAGAGQRPAQLRPITPPLQARLFRRRACADGQATPCLCPVCARAVAALP